MRLKQITKWLRLLTLSTLIFSFFPAPNSYAEKERLKEEKKFSFTPKYNPNKPRNYLLFPFCSLLLPGFDQWWERQYIHASIYTGISFGSTIYSGLHSAEWEEARNSEKFKQLSKEQEQDYITHNELERKVALAGQTYFAMGSISAYHSFRTAVATRRSYGSFTFLKKDESPPRSRISTIRFSIFDTNNYYYTT